MIEIQTKGMAKNYSTYQIKKNTVSVVLEVYFNKLSEQIIIRNLCLILLPFKKKYPVT